ncbi:MAG: DUF2284 domain-containing protein [Lachnospiraceae bacterium]|nr:DUF2284 domain-containing protein [Lachnospiraceae bacterium]
MKQDMLEEELASLPILQWAYLKTERISFLDRVRTICEQECSRYGTSWSCPPAVGTVEECRQRCSRFKDVFVFSTIAEVEDITDMEAVLATRMEHEKITKQITELFQRYFKETLTLSTESCELCKKCSYPTAPCRHPDQMYPCVESYGILVTDLAELGGMDFMNGSNVVTWFSAIFHNLDTN